MNQTIIDYITGNPVPNTGAEANRQRMERLLVDDKGYDRKSIRVDEPIEVTFKGEPYHSVIDLIVQHNSEAVMAFRCVAGSISSYEREILAGARLIYDYQIPFAITTDGSNAIIMDTLTGKKIGEGLELIPSVKEISDRFSDLEFKPFDPKKKEREMIIFRSFNMDKINR